MQHAQPFPLLSLLLTRSVFSCHDLFTLSASHPTNSSTTQGGKPLNPVAPSLAHHAAFQLGLMSQSKQWPLHPNQRNNITLQQAVILEVQSLLFRTFCFFVLLLLVHLLSLSSVQGHLSQHLHFASETISYISFSRYMLHHGEPFNTALLSLLTSQSPLCVLTSAYYILSYSFFQHIGTKKRKHLQ